jgi:hypothetical protein
MLNTPTEKKIASVASLNQLVQHEKKKSEPTRSQKDRECLIASDIPVSISEIIFTLLKYDIGAIILIV